jgi:hypothetical protein
VVLAGDPINETHGFVFLGVQRDLGHQRHPTAAAIKDAEAGMAQRRKAIESRVAHLKDYMLAGMMVAGVKKIEGPYLRLSIRDNPEAVEVFDAAQIPAEFMRQPEPPPAAPDKTAIKAAIKAGQEVPGVKLTRSQCLSID